MKKFAVAFLMLLIVTSIASAATVPVITTSRLPDGSMWWHYSEMISVLGTAPIKWSLVDGDLPSGLELSENGVISGTPQWSGTKYFTVQASNSAGYARRRLSIRITGVFGGSGAGCNAGGLGILALALAAVFLRNRH